MEMKPPSNKKELQSFLGKTNFLRRFIANLSGKTHDFSPLMQLKNEGFVWQSEHQKAFDQIKDDLMHPEVLAPPVRNKPMRLYIYVLDLTTGSMLVQEDDNGVKRPIYYLS